MDKLTYKMLHPSNLFYLDAAVPSMTLPHIFKQIHDGCIQIRACTFEIFEPNQYAAQAACVEAFLNGVVGMRLPDRDSWVKAYKDTPKLSAVVNFVNNPGIVLQHNLKVAQLNVNYCQALWQSSMNLEKWHSFLP
jgi:hypothetical protein